MESILRKRFHSSKGKTLLSRKNTLFLTKYKNVYDLERFSNHMNHADSLLQAFNHPVSAFHHL